MKKLILILLSLIILLGIPGFLTFKVISNPIISNKEVSLQVNEGDSLYVVLDKLKGEGHLKYVPIIKAYLKVTKTNQEIVPGFYTLKNTMNLSEMMSILTGQENSDSINITIPEGYTIEQIAQELEKNNICSVKSFIDAVNTYPLPEYISTEPTEVNVVGGDRPTEITDTKIRYYLEGYLYPDTYKIKSGTHPNEIIKMMLSRFEEVIAEAEKQTNFTLNRKDGQLSRVMIRASIIEKEASSDKDRPLISAVILNRLEVNKPLEIDATVLYAMNKHKEKTLYKDLDTPSIYNTYAVYGLPPTAICNPGIKSIIASIEPNEEALNKNNGYIYYLLDPATKDHVFMKDYSEFKEYKALWYPN